MSGFLTELRRRNVLRVAIGYAAVSWLIVQILETVLPIFGLPETHIRLLLIGLLVGFLPAMALSWAFEWSPTGIRAQADIDSDAVAAAAPRSSRRFDQAIIVVLSLAVLYFATDRFVLKPAMNSGNATIAVLPFADMTESQDQAYFGDGIAEELLNTLTKIPALRVASRTSSFSFRESLLSIGEIAGRLGVSYVLEGSIRRSGERIRVTAQLISADDDFHLWSESYDRNFGEIFSIQDDIAAQIVGALQLRVLGDMPNIATTDPEAYALFLQAGYIGMQADKESLREAITLYQRALEIDADYAPAWSGLAATYSNLAANGFLDFDEGHRMAKDAALTSIRVDPEYSPGYARLAWSDLWYSGDLDSAVTNMQRALDLDRTNLITLSDAAVLLINLGQIESAMSLQEYIVERSPLDSVAFFNLALNYKYVGRLDDAERTFRKLLDTSPNYESARYNLGETLLLQNRFEEARAIWQVETDDAYRMKGQALALYALGRNAEADDALAEFIDAFGAQWPSEVAHVYAYRGDADNAFAFLEKEYEAYGPGGWGEWQLQPLYASLRSDPRWQEYLARAGATPEQLGKYQLTVPLLSQRSPIL